MTSELAKPVPLLSSALTQEMSQRIRLHEIRY